jgi:hypothetical protein
MIFFYTGASRFIGRVAGSNPVCPAFFDLPFMPTHPDTPGGLLVRTWSIANSSYFMDLFHYKKPFFLNPLQPLSSLFNEHPH